MAAQNIPSGERRPADERDNNGEKHTFYSHVLATKTSVTLKQNMVRSCASVAWAPDAVASFLRQQLPSSKGQARAYNEKLLAAADQLRARY